MRVWLCPKIADPAISPGQKWWWTALEIEISCSQWEGSSCTHEWSSFFLFEKVGGEGFFVFSPCSPCVPIKFQKRSPQDVPTMVYPKFNSHVYKPKRSAIGSTFVSFWQLGVQRSASICGVPNLPKYWSWGNQYGPFQKEKEKVWIHPGTH